MKKGIFGKNKIPRIFYLKIRYGSDLIDYIKDDYGVERFVEEELAKADTKQEFYKSNPLVKEFALQWLLFVDYYKSRFGQSVRDKQALDKLVKEKRFHKIFSIYDFRCRLFKSDFSPNIGFKEELKKFLKLLTGINAAIFAEKQKRVKYLIKNKEW